MLLKDIDSILTKEFQLQLFNEVAINGIQVGKHNQEIQTICLAVDSTLETVKKAIKNHADLLIVHHGLFWGQEKAITGPYFDIINMLVSHHCALYAIHLPLDSHPIYGNNAQLANIISKTPQNGAFLYKGSTIGIVTEINDIATMNSALKNHFPFYKAYNLDHLEKKPSYKVGIISGQLSFDFLNESINLYDILITGEVNLPLFNKALDHLFPLITLGHYYSERLGVLSIKDIIEKYDNLIKCLFIEEIKPI